MSTPSGHTITAVAPDGTTADVTEAVQVLYDLVVQSLDWGSGFLSVEDVLPIYRLATLCGFGESPVNYLIDQKVDEKFRLWDSKQPFKVPRDGSAEYHHRMEQLEKLGPQWKAEAEAELSADAASKAES